jgi:hypothetical protein
MSQAIDLLSSEAPEIAALVTGFHHS